MAYLVRYTTTNWAEILTSLTTLEAEPMSVPSYQNWDRVTMSMEVVTLAPQLWDVVY